MVTSLTAMLDRERDEEFRRHMGEAHGVSNPERLAPTAALLVFAKATPPVGHLLHCETCERYAESVGTQE